MQKQVSDPELLNSSVRLRSSRPDFTFIASVRLAPPPPRRLSLRFFSETPERRMGPTYDVEVTGHLFGSEAVGDLADVVAAVFQPQVGDGEAGDAPCPAGVRRQRPAVLQPPDGGVWVPGCDAGQLHAVSHLHLAGLEVVQH